jgi:hypothetical protein
MGLGRTLEAPPPLQVEEARKAPRRSDGSSFVRGVGEGDRGWRPHSSTASTGSETARISMKVGRQPSIGYDGGRVRTGTVDAADAETADASPDDSPKIVGPRPIVVHRARQDDPARLESIPSGSRESGHGACPSADQVM